MGTLPPSAFTGRAFPPSYGRSGHSWLCLSLQYVDHEFEEMGVTRCQVNLILIVHPVHPEWPLLDIEAIGHRLADTWELAAIRALTTFCDWHPVVITLASIGLFLTVQGNDPRWQDWVHSRDYLADFCAHETIWTSIQCMNALYHLQALQNKVLTQLVDLAGAYHTMATNRDEQIQELEKEIEHRDTQIGQLEGQV